jgi:hypothetical protein
MVIRASAVNELSFPEGPSESLLKLMAIKKAIVASSIFHFESMPRDLEEWEHDILRWGLNAIAYHDLLIGKEE